MDNDCTHLLQLRKDDHWLALRLQPLAQFRISQYHGRHGTPEGAAHKELSRLLDGILGICIEGFRLLPPERGQRCIAYWRDREMSARWFD